MQEMVALGVGAISGAGLRYGIALWSTARWGGDFPYGTLIVNLAGSLILGFFLATVIERPNINPAWRLLIGTGFCGSLTTFSTFSYETLALISQGSYGAALLNSVGSVVVGLVAVGLGMRLAQLLLSL